MAISVQNSTLAWQEVKNQLALREANPFFRTQFKALKERMAAFGNPQLQIIPFINTSIDDAGGQVLANAACTLYAVYGKKAATATAVYLVMFDDATDDAGAGTDGRLVIPFLRSGEEASFVAPKGIAMPTGVVAKAYTDFDGTTDSTDTDCPSGFIVIGPA